MSAARVPRGWSQQAADFVWGDWKTRITGLINGWSYDALSVIPGLLLSPVNNHSGDGEYYNVSWSNSDARLRAWAAVGAPVYVPSVGSPSLAEWILAIENYSDVRPMWDIVDTKYSDQPLRATWKNVVSIRIDVEDEPTIWLTYPANRYVHSVHELYTELDIPFEKVGM